MCSDPGQDLALGGPPAGVAGDDGATQLPTAGALRAASLPGRRPGQLQEVQPGGGWGGRSFGLGGIVQCKMTSHLL